MSWLEHAACRGRKDIDWFPLYDARPALAVCETCTVREACLNDAFDETYQNGIRGGYTPAERDRMVSRMVRRPVAVCGTDAGYYRHLRITRTPTCAACRAAHARSVNDRSRKRSG